MRRAAFFLLLLLAACAPISPDASIDLVRAQAQATAAAIEKSNIESGTIATQTASEAIAQAELEQQEIELGWLRVTERHVHVVETAQASTVMIMAQERAAGLQWEEDGRNRDLKNNDAYWAKIWTIASYALRLIFWLSIILCIWIISFNIWQLLLAKRRQARYIQQPYGMIYDDPEDGPIVITIEAPLKQLPERTVPSRVNGKSHDLSMASYDMRWKESLRLLWDIQSIGSGDGNVILSHGKLSKMVKDSKWDADSWMAATDPLRDAGLILKEERRTTTLLPPYGTVKQLYLAIHRGDIPYSEIEVMESVNGQGRTKQLATA